MCNYKQLKLWNSIKEHYYKKYHSVLKFRLSLNDSELNPNLRKFSEKVETLEYKNQILDYLDGTNNSLLSNQCNDYISLIVSTAVKCNLKITEDLKEICENVYLVGGSVRNQIIGEESKDFDFCTDLSYDKLKEGLSKRGYKIQEEGKEFLVLIASDETGQYEIANFRKDGTYKDGRRPEKVDIGTMQDDSERRDFTVNALYYNLKTNLVLDPCGLGIDDCVNKILRFNGNPEDRLKEDYLRGWRAFRFQKKYNFKMERNTEKTIRSNFKEIYENSNPARVLQELIKF